MRWLDFPPLAEFVDRSGVTRSIRGCSLMGRFEFRDRLEQLKTLLAESPPDSSWEDLYGRNLEFRAVVDRCLQLNHLDADWLTPAIVEQLLIGRKEDGVWLPGWLVELNSSAPSPSHSQEGDGRELTLAEALAALSTHCPSLIDAIELAQNVPATVLVDTLNAKAEMLKSPEQKQEAVKRTRLEELRQVYHKVFGG